MFVVCLAWPWALFSCWPWVICTKHNLQIYTNLFALASFDFADDFYLGTCLDGPPHFIHFVC